VCFIGDSITDCGRLATENGLGTGYVQRISEMVPARYPQRRIQIINKGISGNTVRDLRNRWQKDVLQPRFDWLYICIGINDVWRQLDSAGVGAVYLPEYANTLEELVQKATGTGTRVVLMETPLIEEDANSEGNRLLEPYNKTIHDIAAHLDLDPVVPINQVFRRNLAARPDLRLTADGVHPTLYGHTVMAITVLESAGW